MMTMKTTCSFLFVFVLGISFHFYRPVYANTCFDIYVSHSKQIIFSWLECASDTDGYLVNTTNSPIEGFPYTVPSSIVADNDVLPASSQNILLTLMWIDAYDCSTTAVARSYDGYDWEGIPPTPLHPSCVNVTAPNSGEVNRACSIPTKSHVEGNYRVDATVTESISSEDAAGRLLLQATFGPTTEEVRCNYRYRCCHCCGGSVAHRADVVATHTSSCSFTPTH